MSFVKTGTPGEEVKTAMQYENGTYFDWYARKLGSVSRYAKMTPDALRRKLTMLERDYQAIVNHLKSDPDSIFGKEISKLLTPHYDAAVKESKKRKLGKAA